MNSSENNGGKTSYYDLPRPSRKQIEKIIAKYFHDQTYGIETAVDEMLSILPNTLNDLIEHKDMRFWRGDAFKALYALEERATKANDGSTTEERELNKVIYNCQRRLNAIQKEKAQTTNNL